VLPSQTETYPLTDLTFLEDPYPVYHRMRQHDPVYWSDALGHWVLTRYDDVLAALGYEPPAETVVNSFQGYASRLYRPPAGFVPDWKALYVQQAPPGDSRGGLVSPVEGGR
jgi:cytochrome P450